MATQGNYYLNGPNLATATQVFTDAALTVCASDGWYSDGTISRQLQNCILLPQETCADCNVVGLFRADAPAIDCSDWCQPTNNFAISTSCSFQSGNGSGSSPLVDITVGDVLIGVAVDDGWYGFCKTASSTGNVGSKLPVSEYLVIDILNNTVTGLIYECDCNTCTPGNNNCQAL
jgi:hypothetical protein